MLFAGWEVRIVKNCDRGLENAARGRRPRAAFLRPRSQFFTIRTDPKPVNNLFIFVLSLKRLWKNSRKRYCDRGQREENPDRAKNQSDCRIRYRDRLEKK